jgi:hypothetical protein
VKKNAQSKREGISDDSVFAATGKRWDAWYAILDKADASTLSHTEIARYLYIHHLKNNGWWCQMIANRYEQVRGFRKKHQNAEGFQISVSATVPVPLIDLYAAWAGEAMRSRWLKEDGFEITKITPNVSMRILWIDKKTRVAVSFLEKGPAKSRVVIEHSKLPNELSVAKMKLYWKKKLEKMLILFSKIDI